jgi:hypothetical protein
MPDAHSHSRSHVTGRQSGGRSASSTGNVPWRSATVVEPRLGSSTSATAIVTSRRALMHRSHDSEISTLSRSPISTCAGSVSSQAASVSATITMSMASLLGGGGAAWLIAAITSRTTASSVGGRLTPASRRVWPITERAALTVERAQPAS